MSSPAPTPWYATLPESTREAVFATMRAIDAEYTAHAATARRLAPQWNEARSGAADQDAHMASEARRSFLSYLRRGLPHQEAATRAKADCAELIRQWNATHRDYNQQRWDGGQDACIDGLARRIQLAIERAG